MKKVLALLMALILLLSMLTACSAGKSSASQNNTAYPAEMPAGEGAYDAGYGGGGMSGGAGTPPAASPSSAPKPEMAEMESGYDMDDSVSNISAPIIAQGGNGLAEKIIYTIYADIESVDFDTSVDAVYEMLTKYDAFIESSYVGGRNYAQTYYNHQTYRSARFVLRVPKERLAEATEGLDVLGSVTSLQSDAQNITAQFMDTESRLTTYRTEETRLLDMLGKADTVADMIVIESRLSEVRYQIESLTSTLKNWQNQVDYSTMTLYINEVEKLSEIVVVQRSYWTQLGDGIKSTLKSVGSFFKDLFKWVVVNSPVLIIFAVIIVVAILIVRKKLRREKKTTPPDDKE